MTFLEYQPIKRILVAYDGSSTGKNILQFLINSSCFQGVELHLLTVVKDRSDQSAIAQFQEAQQKLQQAGLEPICSLLEGEPERAIA